MHFSSLWLRILYYVRYYNPVTRTFNALAKLLKKFDIVPQIIFPKYHKICFHWKKLHGVDYRFILLDK